jgi:hypothetical protein
MICITSLALSFKEAVDLICPSKIRFLFGFNFIRIDVQHFNHKNFESAVVWELWMCDYYGCHRIKLWLGGHTKKVQEFWHQLSCNLGLQFLLHTCDSSCAGFINTTAHSEQLLDAQYVTMYIKIRWRKVITCSFGWATKWVWPSTFAQFCWSSYKRQQSLTPAREECNK